MPNMISKTVLDANESAFFERQLELILSRTFEIEYPEIKNAETLRQELAIINLYLIETADNFQKPFQNLLEKVKKDPNLSSQLDSLNSIHDSIQLIKGMIETLPNSPLGKRLERINFSKIPTGLARERDRIYFFDSIFCQHLEEIRDRKKSLKIMLRNEDESQLLDLIPNIEFNWRILALAYEDRYRAFSKIIRAVLAFNSNKK